MTPTNRFPADPADVGREVIEAATGFRIEAHSFGGCVSLRYRISGEIDTSAEHAAGKAGRLLRTLLAALEARAAEDREDCDDCDCG